MSDPLDPQVQAAVVSSGAGLLTGIAATIATYWQRARRRGSQEQRCEKVCWSMINTMEAMLAAMEAIGAEHPGLRNAIINVRVQVARAREYLEGDNG